MSLARLLVTADRRGAVAWKLLIVASLARMHRERNARFAGNNMQKQKPGAWPGFAAIDTKDGA
jgi:hypothetical protein